MPTFGTEIGSSSLESSRADADCSVHQSVGLVVGRCCKMLQAHQGAEAFSTDAERSNMTGCDLPYIQTHAMRKGTM